MDVVAVAVAKADARLKHVLRGDDRISVLDPAYNADPLGVIDATTALQAAADAAADTGMLLYSPPGAIFKTSATLVIKGSCAMAGTLIRPTSALAPAVEVRHPDGGVNRISDLTCYLPDVEMVVTSWSAGALPTAADGYAALGCGVRLTNILTSRVFAGRISGFSVGLYVYARDTAGYNAHNTIHLGHCQNNKVNLLIGTDNNTTDSATASACNENVYIGGRLSHFSGAVAAVGTRHILIDACASQANNHRFFGQSIEGDVAEYHVENYGRDTPFFGLRWEVSVATTPKYRRGTKLVTCKDATTTTVNCRNDQLVWGYNANGVIITDSSGAGGLTILDEFQLQVGQITLTGASGLNATAGVVKGSYFQVGTSGSGPKWVTGSGSPEGVVAAVVGSVYSRDNGSLGTSLYLKQSGSGNTGWVPISEYVAQGRRHFATGKFYATPTAGTVGIDEGQDALCLVPFLVPETVVVQSLSANVTQAAASATVRLGIYACGAGTDLPSGVPLVDTGTGLSAATTGIKTSTTNLPITLTPGLYWLAAVYQGAAAVKLAAGRHMDGALACESALAALATEPHNSYYITGVTGALPTNPSTATTTGLGYLVAIGT